MLSYACPSCRKTLQSPEDQAGTTLTCPHCQAEIRVPAAAKSNTTLIWVLGCGALVLFACPIIIVVCLAATWVMGSNASAKFNVVAQSIGSSTPPPRIPEKEK